MGGWIGWGGGGVPKVGERGGLDGGHLVLPRLSSPVCTFLLLMKYTFHKEIYAKGL